MDRAFLSYYEDELSHIRDQAAEFAALNPTVARNLSLDTVPCPDPYVERLLEGVAFLAARTRAKVDSESTRYVRNLLDALYPDLTAPAPAMTITQLTPGPQVETMLSGHVVEKGARLVSGLREGLSTRSTFTSVQDVHLWPVKLASVEYLQDTGALKAAGLSDSDISGAVAGIRLTLAATGAGNLSSLTLDQLDIYLGGKTRGGALFDAIFGYCRTIKARPSRGKKSGPFRSVNPPDMIGIKDSEAMLPRVRAAFEGYRLLREYFLMPERFYYARLAGLLPVVSECEDCALECVLLLNEARPALSDIDTDDLQLFTTPLVNLFEKECNIVELDPRTHSHVVHADRTRLRDFEIYRLLRVEDADSDGPEARVQPLYSASQNRGGGYVYATERRPRRPGEDEIRRGQARTGYPGDDFFVSVSRMPNATTQPTLKRLDIRALCTNRDLCVLDDTPTLTMESGDPVGEIRLLQAFQRPRPSLSLRAPQSIGAEAQMDDIAWRLIAQLSLNYLSLAEEGKDAEPLRAMLDLYADRGDPRLARHVKSITAISSKPVVERLGISGPICFGHGIDITLHIDDSILVGNSSLLLSALLSKLFARHASINSFVRTRSFLTQEQGDVVWPMTPGNRKII